MLHFVNNPMKVIRLSVKMYRHRSSQIRKIRNIGSPVEMYQTGTSKNKGKKKRK